MFLPKRRRQTNFPPRWPWRLLLRSHHRPRRSLWQPWSWPQRRSKRHLVPSASPLGRKTPALLRRPPRMSVCPVFRFSRRVRFRLRLSVRSRRTHHLQFTKCRQPNSVLIATHRAWRRIPFVLQLRCGVFLPAKFSRVSLQPRKQRGQLLSSFRSPHRRCWPRRRR